MKSEIKLLIARSVLQCLKTKGSGDWSGHLGQGSRAPTHLICSPFDVMPEWTKEAAVSQGRDTHGFSADAPPPAFELPQAICALSSHPGPGGLGNWCFRLKVCSHYTLRWPHSRLHQAGLSSHAPDHTHTHSFTTNSTQTPVFSDHNFISSI